MRTTILHISNLFNNIKRKIHGLFHSPRLAEFVVFVGILLSGWNFYVQNAVHVTISMDTAIPGGIHVYYCPNRNVVFSSTKCIDVPADETTAVVDVAIPVHQLSGLKVEFGPAPMEFSILGGVFGNIPLPHFRYWTFSSNVTRLGVVGGAERLRFSDDGANHYMQVTFHRPIQSASYFKLGRFLLVLSLALVIAALTWRKIVSAVRSWPAFVAIRGYHSGSKVFTPFVTQVCKGAAALMLLAHHLFYNSNPEFYSEELHVFALKCKICVAMFLVLSGAGISLSGCSWKKTFIYRIPQMLLNYWFVGVVFVLMGMKFFGMTFEAAYPNGTEWTFWLQLFGVNWITPCGGFNPTWWFMDAIIPLYFFAPLFSLLAKWNPIAVILVAFVAPIFPWDFHCWITPFAFGMVAVTANSFERLAGKRNAVIGLAVYSILLVVSYRWHTHISQHFLHAFSMISIVCCLCVIGGRVLAIAVWPLAFIGRHSMNIFLMHSFFLIWFGNFFTTNRPFVTYPILLGASLICSILIERAKTLICFDKLIALLKEVAK